MVAPVEKLVLNIEPHQDGSGDPSPSNIRPISGYDAVNVYRSSADTSNPTVYNISLSSAGTVYGGSLDVTTGELTIDKGYTTVGDITWRYDSTYTRFYGVIPDIITGIATRRTPFICSAYQTIDDGRTLSSVPDGSIYGAGSTANVYIKDTRYTDFATFKSEMGDVQIVYPLMTPSAYQLTPTEVTTLLGDNTIWMDANGELEMTYTGYIN